MLGKLSTSSPLREDALKLIPGFLGTSPHAPFLFTDSALYPFTVINHGHMYDYMLSSVSTPSESLSLVLGIPSTVSLSD